MSAPDKTKRQLFEEIRVLRSRNAKLESISHEIPGTGDALLRPHADQALQENKELHSITPSNISERKMKNKTMNRLRITDNLILIGVGLAAFFWICESGIHAFIFHNGNFLNQIPPSNAEELWMRLVVCLILVWFSVYAQISVKQLRQAKARLQQSHNELEFRVRERTAKLTITNEILQIENTKRKKAGEALRST